MASSQPLAWTELDAAAVDPLDPDAIWSVGDLVRYRIESNALVDTPLSWTLELELTHTEHSEFHAEWIAPDPLCGYVRARTNHRMQQFREEQPAHFVAYEQDDALVRVHLTRHGPPTQTFETTTKSTAVAHTAMASVDAMPTYRIGELFRVLLGIEALFDELLNVVQAPSAWSVLTRGMRVDITLDFHRPDRRSPPAVEVIQVESPLGIIPAFWLPVTLRANGQDALICRLLVTWRQSPLLLSAGVLRLEAHHPSDPSKRVAAWLIDARRGPHSAPDRDDLGIGLRRGISEHQLLQATSTSVTAKRRWTLRQAEPEQSVEVLELSRAPEESSRHESQQAVLSDGALQFIGSRQSVAEYLNRRGFEPVESAR